MLAIKHNFTDIGAHSQHVDIMLFRNQTKTIAQYMFSQKAR